MSMKIGRTLVVGIAGFAFGMNALAQNETTREMTGEIVEVSTETDSLTVRMDENGQTRMFTVDEDTEIRFEGRYSRLQDGALSELDPGDEVRLIVETRAGRERIRNFERDRTTQRVGQTTRESTRIGGDSTSQGTAQTAQNRTSPPIDGSQMGQQQQQQQQRQLPSTATPVWLQLFVGGLFLIGVAGFSRLARSV